MRLMTKIGPKVAVIGCGPSGLVTAKSLLQAGLSPVVFEASSGLGGLWNAGSHRLWKSAMTNLSRYTCSFTDFPWSSDASLFPTAADVSEYLHGYAHQFIPEGIVQFNSQVKKLAKDGSRYKLTWSHPSSEEEFSEVFQYVVVASGFFSKARVDPLLTAQLAGHAPISSADPLPSFTGQILHSLDYYEPSSFANKRVAVVGGAFSGCEVAAELAQVEGTEVLHISPVDPALFIVPRFLPESLLPAAAYLPIDLVFYQISPDRWQDLLQAEQRIVKGEDDGQGLEQLVKTSTQQAQAFAYFRALTGQHDKATVDADAGHKRRVKVAIAEHYQTLLHAGVIQRIPGYLSGLTHGPSTLGISSSRHPADGETQQLLEGVDSVILCSGYEAKLDFLDDELLQILQAHRHDHDQSYCASYDNFMPLELYKDMLHPALPGLYFVGLFKGSYFGTLQMQAETVAGYLSQRLALPSFAAMAANMQQMANMRSLSTADGHRPQFPHGDYIGQLLDLYHLQHGQLPPALQQRAASLPAVLVPALLADGGHAGAAKQMDELAAQLSALRGGRGVAKSIFQSLAYTGDFALQRDILDHGTSTTSKVEGKVSFRAIARNPFRLVYREEGRLTLPQGNGLSRTFEVSAAYVYEYNADRDCIDIFFSKVGEPEVIDRPFISLYFKPPPAAQTTGAGTDAETAPLVTCASVTACSPSAVGNTSPRSDDADGRLLGMKGWTSAADHLCGQDLYKAGYGFGFAGLVMGEVDIVFDVRGPSKNYRSTSKLTALR